MKLKKTLILSTIVLGTLVGGTYAMYGQGHGNGQGHGMGQGFGKTLSSEQISQLQSMSQEDRQAYVQKLRAEQGFTIQQGHSYGKGMRQGQGQGKEHSGNPADMIKDIPAGTVDEAEKTMLINQYGEEKMARDLYNYAYEKYGIQTFANIAKAEQKHMDAVKALLDRYNISAPSDYAKDNELYNTLKSNIDKSEKDAIEVGITVEMVDIDNMIKDIQNTDNDDIKIILTKIGGASYNHMRGFVKALNNAGYTTDLKWTNYLSEDDINTRGPLTYKLAEKLEAEGVSLPKQASSEYLKTQCSKSSTTATTTQRRGQNMTTEERTKVQSMSDKERAEYRTATQDENGGQQLRGMIQNQNVRKYVNQEKVQKYKNFIEDKYASKINSFTQEQLQEKIKKINEILEKIVNGTYPNKTKETYTNILLALKASLLDRLDTENENSDFILNSVLGE